MSTFIYEDKIDNNAVRRSKRTISDMNNGKVPTVVEEAENMVDVGKSKHEPTTKIAKTASQPPAARPALHTLQNGTKRSAQQTQIDNLLLKLQQPELTADISDIDITPILSATTTKKQTNNTITKKKQYSDDEAIAAIKKWELATQKRLEENGDDSDVVMHGRNAHSIATEYSESIFNHLKMTERTELSTFNLSFMDEVQGDLSYPMRAILIDWLVEVCEEFSLQPQTFFLGIAYLDRFLSLVPIDRSQLQLLGVTSLLTASKFWEIYPPSVDDYIYIADNTYDRQEVLRMENSVLLTLEFRLAVPTPYDFLQQLLHRLKNAPKDSNTLSTLSDSNQQAHDLVSANSEETSVIVDDTFCNFANFVIEFFVQDSTYITCLPSIVASSAIFYTNYTFDVQPCWPSSLQKATGYDESELQTCVTKMYAAHRRLWEDISLCKAVRDKYSEKFNEVGKIPPKME